MMDLPLSFSIIADGLPFIITDNSPLLDFKTFGHSSPLATQMIHKI